MKCSPNKHTEVAAEGGGPSVAVIVNQDPGDAGGWTIELFAHYDIGPTFAGLCPAITTVAGTGHTLRLACMATMPGARGWSAMVRPPFGATLPIDVTLVTDAVTCLGAAALGIVAVQP